MFRNFRDKSWISHLARQIMPECSNQIVRIFNEATEEPFSHILFDLRQSCPEVLRYRTKINNKEFSSCYCFSDCFNKLKNHEKVNSEQTYFTCVDGFQSET